MVKPAPLLSTYDGGYYKTGQGDVPEIKEEPIDDYTSSNPQNVEMQSDPTHVLGAEHGGEPSSLVPSLEHDELERVEPDHEHTTRCPVHGCDTTDNVPNTKAGAEANPTVDHDETDQTMLLLFPSSMEVSDTGANSALNNFNLLVESEPNLVLGGP